MGRHHPRRNTPARSTPAGEHKPVMLAEVLHALEPKPGEVAVDCTLGFAGHSLELLRRVAPGGRLIAMDLDQRNLEAARPKLAEVSANFHLHHGNFAGLSQVLTEAGVGSAGLILADLGMSSMQVDDSERGFSYRRDGPLDMRMDLSRGKTAADLLASLPADELAQALAELGDEPQAQRIAEAIVQARQREPLTRTLQLAQVIQQATGQQRWSLHPRRGQWNLHPAARTFQALRILVNRELANLRHLLRILPQHLTPSARVAILTFHSGEDRLVKSAFREGQRQGIYARVSDEPVRASFAERGANPRARSAKLRWAVAGG